MQNYLRYWSAVAVIAYARKQAVAVVIVIAGVIAVMRLRFALAMRRAALSRVRNLFDGYGVLWAKETTPKPITYSQTGRCM